MIYITQGHEKSIGLEVFLKSLHTISPDDLALLCFCGKKKDLLETSSLLKIDLQITSHFLIFNNQFKISFLEIHDDSKISPTLSSLLAVLKIIKCTDLLITLPTSKDQLFYKNQHHAGYTEFFRKFYHKPDLGMLFKGPSEICLLMTDHIPLSKVCEVLDVSYMVHKLKTALISLHRFSQSPKRVVWAGINPHAGENGLLGNEDERILLAIDILQKDFPHIEFIGPISGDTLHFYSEYKVDDQLLVYNFHDQGLPKFKALNKLEGANITLGLEFIRMSVDHGTSFHLYGKNLADPSGANYVMKEALKWHAKFNKLV